MSMKEGRWKVEERSLPSIGCQWFVEYLFYVLHSQFCQGTDILEVPCSPLLDKINIYP